MGVIHEEFVHFSHGLFGFQSGCCKVAVEKSINFRSISSVEEIFLLQFKEV